MNKEEIVRGIKTTNESVKEKEWNIWTLCEADIKGVCEHELNTDFDLLSEDEKEEIAIKFKKGFESVNDDWEEQLKDAINEVI